MRILYLGLPLGALHLTAHGHRPVVACISPARASGSRRLRGTLGRAGTLLLGRPNLGDPAILGLLSSARPEVLLSWFWPRRIPPAVLQLPERGAFGVHPSLLPRWRGPDPYYWALEAGDEATGVTLHRLAEEYDTGAIVGSRRLKIGADDDSWSLARRLDAPSLSLLAEAADRLEAGESLRGSPQDPAAVTLAPRPTPEDLGLDFRRDVGAILRHVRAAAPWPGVTADFAGHEVDVLRARPYPDALPAALGLTEARCVTGGVAVRVADGAVLVTRVRIARAAPYGGAGGDGAYELLTGEEIHRLFTDQSS